MIGESTTSFEIQNLLPFSVYMVQVAAVSSDGVVGERSVTFNISTPEARE